MKALPGHVNPSAAPRGATGHTPGIRLRGRCRTTHRHCADPVAAGILGALADRQRNVHRRPALAVPVPQPDGNPVRGLRHHARDGVLGARPCVRGHCLSSAQPARLRPPCRPDVERRNRSGCARSAGPAPCSRPALSPCWAGRPWPRCSWSGPRGLPACCPGRRNAAKTTQDFVGRGAQW
jgi:hypothetical protein